MEKTFHHKTTGITFPICLGKRSVHNFSHSVNMAATLNFMEMLVKQYPGAFDSQKFKVKVLLQGQMSIMHPL